MAERTCDQCGAPVEALEVLGIGDVTPPFCAACSAGFAAEDERRERDGAIVRALERAGMTRRTSEWTLMSYPEEITVTFGPKDAAKKMTALSAGEAWLEAHRLGARRNLWLGGPHGTGKTGLAWAIIRALVADAVAAHFNLAAEERPASPRVPALIVHWPNLLAELKETFRSEARSQARGDAPDASALYERARRVDVLVLDELGGERPTPFAREALARLVEMRYQAERPVIVTANYGSQEVAARLGQDDPAEGTRIVSRLVDGAVGYHFEGESRRRAAGAR